MLGCFTRTASGAGLLLILLYYFCNPPFVGYFYSLPAEGSYLIINKNLVEAAGLLVTLVMGSGRYYGLDRIIHGWPRAAPCKASNRREPRNTRNDFSWFSWF